MATGVLIPYKALSDISDSITSVIYELHFVQYYCMALHLTPFYLGVPIRAQLKTTLLPILMKLTNPSSP